MCIDFDFRLSCMVKLSFYGFGCLIGGFFVTNHFSLSRVCMYLSDWNGFYMTSSGLKVYIDFSECGGRLITISCRCFLSVGSWELRVLIHFGVSGPWPTSTSSCSRSFIKSLTLAILSCFISSLISRFYSYILNLPFITV